MEEGFKHLQLFSHEHEHGGNGGMLSMHTQDTIIHAVHTRLWAYTDTVPMPEAQSAHLNDNLVVVPLLPVQGGCSKDLYCGHVVCQCNQTDWVSQIEAVPVLH